MLRKLQDLTGKTFGRLVVLKRDGKISPTRWICQCSCKNNTIKSIRGDHLKNNSTKSCGCLIETVHLGNKKYNNYEFRENYVIGYTNKGEEFYFDINDYEKIRHLRWYKDNNGYIVNKSSKENIKMHRFILDLYDPNKDTDHINNVKYDNRRFNLRICSRSQNNMNIPVRNNNTSGVTGVDFHTQSGKWRARISKKGKVYSLGLYETIEEAIEAREIAEKKLFGKFRYKNNKEVI